MIIEYNGKIYGTQTWIKDVLKVLLIKELEIVTSEKKELLALKDYTFGNRIIELEL